MNKDANGRKDHEGGENRSRGRPPRVGQIGRDHLIAKTRELLEAKPKFDIQIREIAKFAGVTPPLVNYYFPDKRHLIEEAVSSVVEDHIAHAQAVIRSSEPRLVRFERLIGVFIEFNADHGFLLDRYAELAAPTGRIQKLAAIQVEVITFIADLMKHGCVKEGQPALIKSVLWGACKYLGQSLDGSDPSLGDERLAKINAMKKVIYTMFAAEPEEERRASNPSIHAPVRSTG